MDPMDSKDLADQNIQKLTDNKKLMRVIAVLTSVYALLAAGTSLMGSRCTTRGIVAKNEAIYYQGLSSNEWAFFQSRNIRKEIGEILGPKNPANADSLARFGREADESFERAKGHEFKRDQQNSFSVLYLDASRTFGAAMAFLQVAIILVPITLLANSLFIFAFGNILGTVGVVYMIVAFCEYFNILKEISHQL